MTINFDQLTNLFTRCAVVGNNMVEDIFLENEGVFVLLDLLLVSSARLHSYMLLCTDHHPIGITKEHA